MVDWIDAMFDLHSVPPSDEGGSVFVPPSSVHATATTRGTANRTKKARRFISDQMGGRPNAARVTGASHARRSGSATTIVTLGMPKAIATSATVHAHRRKGSRDAAA